MNAIEQSAYAGHAVGRAVVEGFRGPARVPLFALLAVRLGLVLVLVLFAHPWLSRLGAPLLARAAGDRALHFPAAIEALPLAHARWSSVLDLVLLPLIVALTCVQVARRLPTEEVHTPAGRGVVKGALVLVPIAFMAAHAERAMLAAVSGLAGGQVSAVVPLAGGFVLLSALTAVSLPLVALVSLGHPLAETAWDAWRWSWRKAGAAYVTLGAGATTASLALVIAYARAAPIVSVTAPEWAAAGFAVETACRVLLQWAVAGAAAVLWIGLVEDPWG